MDSTDQPNIVLSIKIAKSQFFTYVPDLVDKWYNFRLSPQLLGEPKYLHPKNNGALQDVHFRPQLGLDQCE